jgi:DNA-binding MarR family transcriptional regulator
MSNSTDSVISAAQAWHESRSDDRLAHLVRDARRTLSRALKQQLAEQGVAYGHWTFLRILWVREGLTQRELSELAGVMEPTTFAALQAMERLGYITRRRRPDNRKNIYVFLTPQGRALRDRLTPVAEAINARALKGLNEDDLAATRRTLMAIIENLAEFYSSRDTCTRRRLVSLLAASLEERAAEAGENSEPARKQART